MASEGDGVKREQRTEGEANGLADPASSAGVGKRTLTDGLRASRPASLREARGGDVSNPFAVDPDVVPRLHGAPAGEVPYRREMEAAFGADFSDVRAHTGAAAPLAAIGAIAAAHGDTVAFASSAPGRHEVAHELTHVVQQRQTRTAALARLASVEREDSAAEREADGVARVVAAGGRAPAIREAPTAQVARMMIPEMYEKDDPRDRIAPKLEGDTATQWLDGNQEWIEGVVAANLAGAQPPTGHPRLSWLGGPGPLAQAVWGAIVSAGPGFGARLGRLVAPTNLTKRVDEMRTIDESNSTDGVRRGPRDFVVEIAVMIATEVERSLGAATARMGPRTVAAVDAVPAPAIDATCGPRDVATVSPEALVTSHPMDVLVVQQLCAGGTAQVAPRAPGDDEPPLDRLAAQGTGGVRPVAYQWIDDPSLWNWIRVDPADATAEEVALALTGETARANELRASAPFFALPPALVASLAPSRNDPAIEKLKAETSPMALLGDLEELHEGASEDALAGTPTGEEAGLAQAARLAPGAMPDADGAAPAVDGLAMADRCKGQIEFLSTEFGDLHAAPKLAALKGRLEARAGRLATASADERARFGALFTQQSAILYDLAGELQPLMAQARQIQRAEALRTPDDASADGSSAHSPSADRGGIDPAIQALADQFLDAGAVADLPETARARLATARAVLGATAFDSFDAMIGDARARTLSTLPIAESGPGNAPEMMDGPDVARDLRAREVAMSMEVLAARRDQQAGRGSADATKVLGERVRALQVEARLVGAMTQCMYMADRLEQEFGVIAWVSLQLGDLQSARDELLRLYGAMGEVLSGWRDRHAELFATLDAGTCQEVDPAGAARAAIADLEKSLAKLGDARILKALETANGELHDMAIAKIVVDIAVMIGLTLVTSGLGSMAAGAARGLRMGRLVVALADISTQSVAMAGLRAAIYGDSFGQAFGTELVTNLAGFAALRGLAHALPTAKLGKALAVLKESEGAWKYVAHGTELTIEAATQAGIQFAIAEGQSLIKNGRTLTDDELKMLAIQGMGMFLGNAVAHRLAAPALDHLSAYAARIGRPYRRAEVRALAERVGKTGEPEATKALLREERALLDEERALYERIGGDAAERDAMGPQTLGELRWQNETQRGELTVMSVEHAFQHGLTETAPGMAWEGSPAEVEPALAEARAAGATIKTEQRPDGSRWHHVSTGDKHYTVREQAPKPQGDASQTHAADPASASTTSAPLTARSAGLHEPATVAIFETLLQKRPDELKAFLDAFRDHLGLAGQLLVHFGEAAVTHFRARSPGMLDIHGEIEISANKLEQLSVPDLKKLVDVCLRKGPAEAYEYFESTNTGEGKPGARLRFRSRTRTRAEQVKQEIFKSLKIGPADPRAKVLEDLDDGDAVRLWDLFNERAYRDPRVRAQAAEWAFSKNPKSARELVAEMQFYDAEVGARAAAIVESANAALTRALAERHEANGGELTQAEVRTVTRGVTSEYLGRALDKVGPAAEKEAVSRALEQMGMPSADGADSPTRTVGQKAAEDAWSTNIAAQAGPNAAGASALGRVSEAELPARVQAIAGQLAFGTDFDGAYHAHKHAGEIGVDTTIETEMVAYLGAARDLIRSGVGSVRRNQNGSRSVIFSDAVRRVIVNVSVDGAASIATFGWSN